MSREWLARKARFAVVLLGILPGCEGGQTGDSGVTGDGDCGLPEQRGLSLEQADAAGYPATSAINELLEGRAAPGQSVWVTAPPSLWLERGATPPPDRSIEGLLVVEAAGARELRHESAGAEASACDALEVGIAFTISIPELEADLTGTGVLRLPHGSDPGDAPAVVSVDGWELQNDCLLRGQGAAADALLCKNVPLHATSRCLDPAAFVAPPDVPRTELGVLELLAHADQVSPLELHCSDGETASLRFELMAKGSYCEPERWGVRLVPGVLAFASDKLSLPQGLSYGGLSSVRSDERCWMRDCSESSPCLAELTDEASFDEASFARCTQVEIFALIPSAAGLLDGRVTIQIEDDGTTLVAASVGGSPLSKAYVTAPHCYGQRLQ